MFVLDYLFVLLFVAGGLRTLVYYFNNVVYCAVLRHSYMLFSLPLLMLGFTHDFLLVILPLICCLLCDLVVLLFGCLCFVVVFPVCGFWVWIVFVLLFVYFVVGIWFLYVVWILGFACCDFCLLLDCLLFVCGFADVALLIEFWCLVV